MTVIRANEQTLPQAAVLACELWPDNTPDELLAEWGALSPEGAAFFLAEEEGAFAGFAQCQLRRDYVEGTETSPVGYLEGVRRRFVEGGDKADWYDLIQLLPSSYHQMRTVTLNYEVLVNLYYARRGHKLDEWHTLCDEILKLPYARALLGAAGGEALYARESWDPEGPQDLFSRGPLTFSNIESIL